MSNPPVSTSPRPPWRFLVVNFVISRLWLVIVAGLSLLVVKKGKFYTAPHSILDWFKQWDAGWYLDIVRHGYQYLPGQQCSVCFFPMYPLLVRALAGCGIDDRLAGYLVANGALFATTVVLWKLAVHELGDASTANRTVQFLLLTPVGVFFSAIYTESIFLFWLVSALYLARTQRWLLAGLCAYATALSRPVGLLVIIPLAIEYLLQQRWQPDFRRPGHWRVLACCALPGLGLLSYMAYLGWAFGEPLAFMKVEAAWGRQLTWPWIAFFRQLIPFYTIWFDSFAVVALVLLILGGLWRLRLTYIAVIIFFTLICLCSSRLEALPRFLSVLFPFYLVLALLTKKWPKLTPVIFIIFAALQALSVGLFVNGYWFT